LREAAAWITAWAKDAPSMLSLMSVVPSFRWARAGSADDHGVDAHIHAAHLGAGGAADDIANLAHDGAAHRHQVDPVVHHDVQLDGDGGVVVIGDLDALSHGLPAQQMHQAVGLGAHGHAFDAVAVGGRRAGDVGENVAADGDLALFGLKPHLADPFLSVG